MVDRRFKIKTDQKTSQNNVSGEKNIKTFTIDELREIALNSSKKRSKIKFWLIVLAILFVISVGLFFIGKGIAVTQQHTTPQANSLYNISASTPQKGNVFVCTSENSTKYHNNIRCRGLKSCSAEIVEEELINAEDMGYEKCRYCYH